MTHNPILDELHAVRRQLLAEYNGDTAAYLRDAAARLKASGRPISQRKQKAIRCVSAQQKADRSDENTAE